MKFGEEFILIAGKTFAGMKITVETADEGFVIVAEAGNDGRQAGFDLLGVFGLEIVVEEDDDGERECFGGEKFEALFDVVIKDAEFVAGEVGDEMAVAVFYGDRQKDVVHVEFQSGLAVGRILLIHGNLRILRWRSSGSGILSDLGDRRRGRILGQSACWSSKGERK